VGKLIELKHLQIQECIKA